MSKWILDMMIESAVVLVSIIKLFGVAQIMYVLVRLMLAMGTVQVIPISVRSTVESNVCA